MEIHWRSKPIGKVPTTLPCLSKLAEKNFTQTLDMPSGEFTLKWWRKLIKVKNIRRTT
jgi:hypothetical protein